MNLGNIWGKLDKTDMTILCGAITYCGVRRPDSYCASHMNLIVNSHSRLIFFNMYYVYDALKYYHRSQTIFEMELGAFKDQTDNVNRLLEILRKELDANLSQGDKPAWC